MTTLSYNDSKTMIQILSKAQLNDPENSEKIAEFLGKYEASTKEFESMYPALIK